MFLTLSSEYLSQMERVLNFIERYGITQVMLLISLIALVFLIRQVLSGKLVPRWIFDQVVADRDRALDIIENEETGALRELMDFLKKIRAADAESDERALKEILHAVQKTNEPRGGGA